MQQTKRFEIGRIIWRFFCVLLASIFFLYLTQRYFPLETKELEWMLFGLEDSPVRAAFGTLAEGLEAGVPIRDTVSETVRILLEK